MGNRHERVMRIIIGFWTGRRLVGRDQWKIVLISEVDQFAFVSTVEIGMALQLDIEPVAEHLLQS